MIFDDRYLASLYLRQARRDGIKSLRDTYSYALYNLFLEWDQVSDARFMSLYEHAAYSRASLTLFSKINSLMTEKCNANA